MQRENTMNGTFAIPVSDGKVFEHFGKAAQFKIYTVENGKIVNSEVAETDGGGHDAVGLWLVMRGVNAVICGSIGPGSLGALAAAGIVALAGVEGDADEAMAKFIAGELTPSSQPNCSGHGGGCASHCGSGGCGCSSRCGSGGCGCSR